MSGVCKFLGVDNQFTKYNADLTSMIAPLHELLRKSVSWTRGEEQQNAFQSIKDRILALLNLKFDDPTRSTAVSTNASSFVLRVCCCKMPIDFV